MTWAESIAALSQPGTGPEIYVLVASTFTARVGGRETVSNSTPAVAVELPDLSEDQIARFGRFAGEPSAQELEKFFRLDAVALEQAASKRRSHNRLGWSVQWGTVRMLGTFLSAPAEVPVGVAEFVAAQLGIEDPSCLKLYPVRLPTQHEHARAIRRLLGSTIPHVGEDVGLADHLVRAAQQAVC